MMGRANSQFHVTRSTKDEFEMIAQRATQQVLRRFVSGRSGTISQAAAKNFSAPLTVAASSQTRLVTTQKLTPEDSAQILISQRRNRPVAPHLSIYRPQIPWVLSGLNRITGALLSGGFYIFGAAYLVAPLFGWHLESASIAAAFASWPVAAKVVTKFAVAWPFTFHSLNGLRHLTWDMGKAFSNKIIIRTGWAVVGFSAASALALAAMF